MAELLLNINGLHAGYGRAEVLHGLTITARKGKVITVIGPNGAGKTTLLNALMGVRPARGTSEYDGTPIDAPTPAERGVPGHARGPETRGSGRPGQQSSVRPGRRLGRVAGGRNKDVQAAGDSDGTTHDATTRPTSRRGVADDLVGG